MATLLRITFVTRIRDENVKLIVKSRNANMGLAQLCEIVIAEEK